MPGSRRVPRFSAAPEWLGSSRCAFPGPRPTSVGDEPAASAPGVCYRLWSAQEDAALLPRSQPEILETDLAPLALELAVAGVASPAELRWLDPPPEAAFAEARSLLKQLGALDGEGGVTPHGRRLARLAMAPRLAHMVIRGSELGDRTTACELAALLSERDSNTYS